MEKENFASQNGHPTPSAPPGNVASEKPSATLVLIDSDYSGRDEMNLAGNPFALLQAASKNGQNFIRYEWERRLPSGKLVTASWKVSGDSELGMPGPSEELLYLVLLQITRESAGPDGIWPQEVTFSRYNVLTRLGWPLSTNGYKMLRDAFGRLQAVSIQADHSFWDAKTKMPYVSVGFAILDDYALADEPRGRNVSATPRSFFRWNRTLFDSFLAGNVRNMALDFVISLDGPTARRLFRLLDMFRHAEKAPRHEFSIGLFKLRDRLGMAEYKYASKIKEKLAGPHAELIARGYLTGVEYLKTKEGGEMVVYGFKNGRDLMKSVPLEPNRVESDDGDAPKSRFKASFWAEEAIFPVEAQEVFLRLSECEQTRLRDLARAEVEPAFWDRLEKADSPMALVLWEIVAREHRAEYEAKIAE